MNQHSSTSTNTLAFHSQPLLQYSIGALTLAVAIFQIYMFHSQTTYTNGTLHMKTWHQASNVHPMKEKHNLFRNDQVNSKAKPFHLNRNNKDVIVYLAQFSKSHSSYGFQRDDNQEIITGLSRLNKSLELLYTNYVNDFPSCDILIFYDAENGPDNQTMRELSRNRPQVQFRELKGKWWSLPHGLKPAARVTWGRPTFSVGYRHMIRWFAILIWPYLSREGYTHVMRMDDDSYLHSKIQYNLFEYMRDNHKKYGFRMPVLEEAVGEGYDAIVDTFLETNPNVTSQALINTFMNERYVGFYNNWFIAEISFFLSPPTSMFLSLIDQTDIIYKQRTGDLVIHSTVVRLFLEPNQIQYFRDFTYEHMTLCRKKKCGPWVKSGCPQNGGIARGVGAHTDEDWSTFVDKVRARFAGKSCEASLMTMADFIGAEDVRYCSKIYSRCRPYIASLLGLHNASNAIP